MSGATAQKDRKGGGVVVGNKESMAELAKMMDSMVWVKCLGDRELGGALKGYDDLINIVLDECDKFIRGKSI